MSKTNATRSPLSATLVRYRGGRPLCCADRNGQALCDIYFKDKRRRGSTIALFTRDEARHLAASVAKLPELWEKG